MRRRIYTFFRDFFLNTLAGSYLCPGRIRILIYRLFGNKIQTSRISPKCFVGGGNLSIGHRSYVSYGCFFDLTNRIVIGDDVHIAMQSTFITSTHKIANSNRRAGEVISSPIVIKKGCWIGGRVTILPGVTIGEGTIIGAGSVVTKDCESNSVYVGVPAVKIKDL